MMMHEHTKGLEVFLQELRWNDLDVLSWRMKLKSEDKNVRRLNRWMVWRVNEKLENYVLNNGQINESHYHIKGLEVTLLFIKMTKTTLS